MNKIKAFVFDAFGTLFKVNIPTAELDELTAGKGSDLLKIWRSRQLEYTWLRTLMGAWVNFDVVTADALRYATQTLGLTNYEALSNLLMPIYRQPNCFEEVPATLAAMQQHKITTAILSNGTPDMLQTGIEKTGLIYSLDHVFSASRVQQFKVAPAVYQIVLQELRLTPEQVLFFSSNAWDVAGAKHFGFSTVWVNRNDAVFESLGVQPDLEISDLSDWKVVFQ